MYIDEKNAADQSGVSNVVWLSNINPKFKKSIFKNQPRHFRSLNIMRKKALNPKYHGYRGERDE